MSKSSTLLWSLVLTLIGFFIQAFFSSGIYKFISFFAPMILFSLIYWFNSKKENRQKIINIGLIFSVPLLLLVLAFAVSLLNHY